MRDEILATRIERHIWLERPWRCWHDLQHDRAWTVEGLGSGMGKTRIVSRPQPIGWLVIAHWAETHGVPADDRLVLQHQVRAMDGVYLAWRYRRIDSDISRFMKG